MTLRPGQRVHWEKDGNVDRDDVGTVRQDSRGLYVVWDRLVAGSRNENDIDADGNGQIGAESFRAVPVRGER